ncbi:Phytanoyl-CoA dioxygenase domain-containing protein 1 [Seminavis robusta]|uniref:Phytanoyl-CoA dioxygenase domain-containing protein 1 n=1 Tax=Seminavis robusta TaxID=568900 RepID=A0A9N8HBG6_9STRA|nr:Phytanoyl-CoA dioxygenase domain-containing protein 1 [Seminavis robusta]|eukprot:Sro276_g105980.1 Phytanoyl-CoA dioxygenase domain-containing protein 1 (376) ;mRNA; f:37104-38408
MTTETTAFTEEELSQIRSKTVEIMGHLEKKEMIPKSWIRDGHEIDANDQRSDRCMYFDTHGFIKVDQFSDKKEVEALRNQMGSLAEQWDPSSGIDSFGTDTKENRSRGDYFLESSSKVHFFAEPTALLDKENNQKELKPEYQTDKLSALNKSGHAMHMIPGAFQNYAKSEKVRNLVLDLGWKDPVVPQSMYIFKQKRIGGTVTSHQDSTFLYTTPKQSCLGLWLALHDATLDNGCLWVRPGSHWESTRRQFKRNPLHFGKEAVKTRSNEANGDTSAPKFEMEDLDGVQQIPWDGAIPEGGYDALLEAGFVPVECKAGDLLAFNGELDHLSLPNFSDKPRHTFQLHMVEGDRAGVTWSKSNWLQYPAGLPFMRLVE